MSTDWDVYCRTCDSEHGFYDANHEASLMADIIRIAPLIAACAPAVEALEKLNTGSPILQLQGRYQIRPSWFAQHLGHDLVARNEYGGFIDECNEWISCPACGSTHRCRLPPKHEGDHSLKPREKSLVASR